MTKKGTTKTAPKAKGKRAKQERIPGTDRPNRIPELDDAAEAYRLARDQRQAATKVETEKKTLLKEVIKKYGLETSYFYDDEDGDTEEVKPIHEIVEDVKVNKVKQAKAKSDE
jgi:hypothetical protein